MSPSLFSAVTVDRNETISKNILTIKTEYYNASQKKKKFETNWIQFKKTKIHLEQVLNQYYTK